MYISCKDPITDTYNNMEYTMKPAEVKRFEVLYQRHLKLLKLQGKSEKTIEAYSRAVRRITECFDCLPDKLSLEQLENYFAELVDTYSWTTVKIDRLGLMFFWKHVLQLDWQWLSIIKSNHSPTFSALPRKNVSLMEQRNYAIESSF
jgi:Phage integrase, N-terminal SAM-like domain